jgi:hypothetical protein
MKDKDEPLQSTWMLVDWFKIEQAAALWIGADPAGNGLGRTSSERSEIAAALQMLTGAIHSGELACDHTKNPMASIGAIESSIVSRENLMTWARGRQQFPAFLFDTLMPFHNVRAEPGRAPAAAQPNKGGSPAKYDWDAFMLEIIRIANYGGLPKTRAEMTRKMLEWFSDTFDAHPTERLVSERISIIYKALEMPQQPST